MKAMMQYTFEYRTRIDVIVPMKHDPDREETLAEQEAFKKLKEHLGANADYTDLTFISKMRAPDAID